MPNGPHQEDYSQAPAQPAREPAFNLSPVVIAFAALCAALHLLRTYGLTQDQDFALITNGAFIPLRYSGEFDIDIYAFTTPLTYSVLHGGFAHLVINLVWLAAFGSPLANRFGTLRFVLFWAATSVSAAALHYAIHPLDQLPLVGASGAISGMMGAAARFGFRIDRTTRRPAFTGPIWSYAQVLASRGVVTFLAIWLGVNLATGLIGFGAELGQSIAWEAHIGGFAAGFLAVSWFDRRVAEV